MNVALQADEVMRYRDPQFKVPAAKLLPTQYLVVDDGTVTGIIRRSDFFRSVAERFLDG